MISAIRTCLKVKISIKRVTSRAIPHGFKSQQCYLPAIWISVIDLDSLFLNFLFCKNTDGNSNPWLKLLPSFYVC
jgi:hypothetical protein